jgi:hypothetical protein
MDPWNVCIYDACMDNINSYLNKLRYTNALSLSELIPNCIEYSPVEKLMVAYLFKKFPALYGP